MKMSREAQVVDQLFAAHRVQCRVLSPPDSFQTAMVRVYKLARGEGVTVAKVTGLVDELDEALTQLRREPVHCRFDHLPLALEVPRPDPTPLILIEVLKHIHRKRGNFGLERRLLCTVGEANSYNQADCILLDLLNPNSPHALIAGTTGSGKSNLLASMVLSMAVLHSPDKLAMILLDPKGIDFKAFGSIPHLACPVVTDSVAAVRVLAQVVSELEERKQSGINSPHIVLFIDELAELADVAGPQVERHIKRILQVGRALGIHVIAATQKPLASVIGSLVKANFPVRIVGKVVSADDARVAAGISGTGAERLPGKGAMLLLRGGETYRLQVYFLPPTCVDANVAQVGKLWMGVPAPSWLLPSQLLTTSHLPTAEIVSGRPNRSAPEWLVGLVRKFVEEQGKPPSQQAVQRAYQEETGQMLNWDAVKMAIAQGSDEAEVEEAHEGAADCNATITQRNQTP